MKCPYCGHENSEPVCKKCKARIPVEEPKEEHKEPRRVRKTNKESE